MVTQDLTRIEWTGFSWPAAALMVCGSGVILVLTHQALRRGGGTAWVMALTALRLVAVAVLCVALLRPHRVSERKDLLRRKLVVLSDASFSMTLPAGVGDKSRRDLVADRLGRPGGLLDRLAAEYDLGYVEFGGGVREGSAEALRRPTPMGGEADIHGRTDLRAALEAARARYPGDQLRGVVLISDGVDTELPPGTQERHDLLAPAVEALSAPVFTFCPVAQDALVDVGITGLRYSRVGFVREHWELEADVVAVGLGEGTLTVILRSGESVVQIRRVRLEPGRSVYAVPFEFTPTRTGEMVMTVEVQPQPGEAYQANNYAGLVLSVVRDSIRVLQVAGRPSWDVRFLRRTLKEMPTVDLISFFVMRDMMDDPGPPTRDSYVNLIPFPTDELFTRELKTFDVIVFQNFDYRLFQPYPGAFRRYLDNIRLHVASSGAGFVMVGGDRSFDRAGYGATPLASILPVRLTGGEGEVSLAPLRPKLTELGRRHPITRIEQDEEKNVQLWAGMPDLMGCHVLPNLAPGALVLLEHPTLRRDSRPVPIVAVAEAEEGRSMAVATDEVWRWAFGAVGQGSGNRLYLRFWSNALRWLAHELEDRRVSVTLDRRTVAPGARARGAVRALDGKYRPLADARINLRVMAGGGEPALTQELTTDSEGRAPFSFELNEAGAYRVEAGVGDAQGEQVGQTPLQVETPGGELKDLRADEALLTWLSERSGGRSYSIAHAPAPDGLPIESKPVERLLARRSEPLLRGWRAWAVYVLVVGMLCCEWWARRRRGVS